MKFYIRHQGFVGNLLLFWKASKCGYTTHIGEALLVDKKEAEEICRHRPNEDFPMAQSVVEGAATLQVCSERMREMQHAGARDE